MKYQYLVLEEASIIRLEIRVEYMWEDVLKPTDTYRLGCEMLLSIEEGTQIIRVGALWERKKSVRLVASVMVCEAPISTSPDSFSY